MCFLQFDKNTLTDQALELLSLVPEGYIPLPEQIGGHRHVDGKLGERGRIGGREGGRKGGGKGGREGGGKEGGGGRKGGREERRKEGGRERRREGVTKD